MTARRKRATMIAYVVLGIVALTVGAGVVLARMWEPISATDQALGRELQPGLPLAEATALLKRLDVPFTVDSAADGTTVVKFARKTTRDGRTTSVSEQQINFDAQGRLRDMVTATQLWME